MKALNCFDYVRASLNNINMWDLANNLRNVRSFNRPTVELLSTLQFNDDMIKYRLYNRQYEITMGQFCVALLIPPNDENEISTRSKRTNSWETIAMDERKFYRKDSWFITSIELRYIQIILSNSIISTREENTKVKERGIHHEMHEEPQAPTTYGLPYPPPS